MTRRAGKYIALATGIYLLGLVVLFPASLAARWFVPETPGLILGNATGTLWSGRINSAEYRGWNIGAIDWSFRPLALLRLRASANLTMGRRGGNAITTTASLAPGGRAEFHGLRGIVTLADLEQAGIIPRNVASGELMVNLDELVLQDGRPVAASGQLGLSGLRTPFLPNADLGSYAAEIETVNDGIDATFSELEAPLQVAGNTRVTPDGRYRVSGSLRPTPDTPDLLRRGLNLLGSPDSSGQYSFSFEGNY